MWGIFYIHLYYVCVCVTCLHAAWKFRFLKLVKNIAQGLSPSERCKECACVGEGHTCEYYIN